MGELNLRVFASCHNELPPNPLASEGININFETSDRVPARHAGCLPPTGSLPSCKWGHEASCCPCALSACGVPATVRARAARVDGATSWATRVFAGRWPVFSLACPLGTLRCCGDFPAPREIGRSDAPTTAAMPPYLDQLSGADTSECTDFYTFISDS